MPQGKGYRLLTQQWLGGIVVTSRTSDSKVAGSIPTRAGARCRVITLSKLFTLMVLRPTQPSIPPG